MSDPARPPQQSPEAEQPGSRWTKSLEHWHDPTHPYRRVWIAAAFGAGIQFIVEMNGQKRPFLLAMRVMFLAASLMGALIRPPKAAWVKIAMGAAFATALAVSFIGDTLRVR